MAHDTTQEDIILMVAGNLDRAEKAFERELVKKEAADANESWSDWLHWNGSAFIFAKSLKDKWENIHRSVTDKFEAGESVEDVISHLKGLRDGLVERIMAMTQVHSGTNPMANHLQDVESDVLRTVAGASIISSGSLAEILQTHGDGIR